MTDDKFQMTNSPASARPMARQAAKTCRAADLAKAEKRKDRKKGPRMGRNTREDKPQVNADLLG